MLHAARYPRLEIVTETESDIICDMQLAVLITDIEVLLYYCTLRIRIYIKTVLGLSFNWLRPQS